LGDGYYWKMAIISSLRCVSKTTASRSAAFRGLVAQTSRNFPTVNLQVQSYSSSKPVLFSSEDSLHKIANSYKDLSNELLFSLAIRGDHEACAERMTREIMRVDRLEYPEAQAQMLKIDEENHALNKYIKIPYQMGIGFGVISATISLPLVFHLDSVLMFNDACVGEDLPEGGLEDLANVWKVGGYSWGWMEPVMGTMSFVLLGFQFARAQMEKIALTPFTERIKEKKALSLVRRFPQYNARVVRAFGETAPIS